MSRDKTHRRDRDGVPEQGLACATCGRVLGNDPEDEPKGDAGRPICRECNRARNFDVLFPRGDER